MKKTRAKHEAYASALTRLNFLSRKEQVELPRLLLADEKILAVISGFYAAGTAILCVTDKRLLLVDKKWVRLFIEDVRFESINELNYGHQAMMASITFIVAGREVRFQSWYRNELRMLSQLVQQKMFEIHKKEESKEKTQQEVITEQVNQAPQIQAQGYAQDPNLEAYLSERIARWRKASRFADAITKSNKTGRQILNLEIER